MSQATLGCPHCRKEVVADPRLAGDVVSCPHCQGRMTMPPPPAAVGPDRLAWFRERLETARLWHKLTLISGLLFVTVGTLVASGFDHFRHESEAALASMLGRPAPPESSTLTWIAFVLGLVLIGVSQLIAIQVAIRETHLGK